MQVEKEKRISNFDLAFEKEGNYLAVLKSGKEIEFSRRSEIWEDKTKSLWVTLMGCIVGDFTSTATYTYDVRYNEIGAIRAFQ